MPDFFDAITVEGLSALTAFRLTGISQALSASTLTLTSTTNSLQIFTGSTVGQIVQLPSATTLGLGHKIEIENTGTVALSVKDGSGAALATINAGMAARLTLVANSTTAGSWAIFQFPILALTVGSILFANSAGAISQDNANLYWDDVNLAQGIGTIPSTAAVLDIVNDSGSNKTVQLTSYGANGGFRGRYANGTLASPSAALATNILNFISGRGYGTSAFAAASTGAINIVAFANFTTTSMPTDIALMTTPVGSVTSVQTALFSHTGAAVLGLASGSTAVHQFNGGVQKTANTVSSTYTVDSTTTDYNIFANTSSAGFVITLPAPTPGRELVLTDSTGSFATNNLTLAPHSGEKIMGLTSNKVLQTAWGAWTIYSDGTNWFIR